MQRALLTPARRAICRSFQSIAVLPSLPVAAVPLRSFSTRPAPWTQPGQSSSSSAAAARIQPQPPKPAKTTTNIAGLDVVPNGRDVFIGLLKEKLAAIEEYNKQLGFEPEFNKYMRTVTQWRLNIAEEEEEVEYIEQRCWGQIEELIQYEEKELDILVAMNEEDKPWEVDESEVREFEELRSPDFGESEEDMLRGRPKDPTPEEQAEIDKFWEEMDAEIRQDQEREKKEREARWARRRAEKEAAVAAQQA